MGSAVDSRVTGRRSARIRKLSAQKERAFIDGRLGRTVNVLFEHQEGPYWTGYTEDYVRVAVQSGANLTNRVLPVQLTRAHLDTVHGILPGVEWQDAMRGMRPEPARVP